MTTGVVSFDLALFQARFPEFSSVPNEATLFPLYFNEAGLILNNTENSRVVNVEERQPLLYLLTAHIAFLNGGYNGKPRQIVGRISDATEGSVSVSSDMGTVPFNAAWFQQTPYGAQFWQMTAKYRSFLVVPGCSTNPPNYRPPYGGWPSGQ